MNPDIFSEWLIRQGKKVFTTQSSNWVNTGPRVLQSFPYYLVTQPDRTEINDLFKTSNAIALRYSTPCGALEGMLSYHVVYEEDELIYEKFSKKVRHDIHHGLEYCDYKPISLSTMEDQGWRLREETLIRQGRKGAETQKWWSHLCQSAEGLPGFECWGAVKQNLLVASIFTYIEDGTASILFQQSLTEHLKYGINNTIAYAFINDILKNNKASRIFYGLHSLDAPSSVDEFKFRMGFIAQPVRQRVVLNPHFAPLINDISYFGLKTIHKILPGNATVAKAEGMLRFYLEGKKPLEEQNWPDALVDQKQSILTKYN